MANEQASAVHSRTTRIVGSGITHDALFDAAKARGEVTGEVGGPEYMIWRLKQMLAPTGKNRGPHARLQMNDDGQVYFLQAGEDGPIKIGTTKNLRRRLNKLQQGHPEKLIVRALRKGGRKTERGYHDRYAEFQIRGEWFSPSPAILNEIERLTNG